MQKFFFFFIIAAFLMISQTGFGQQAVTSQRQPRAVDLGLSVKWADCNLGASTPEGYGDYYAWGETFTKSEYSLSTYKWCNGSEDSITKYNTVKWCGVVDYKRVLSLCDDAAHVILGGRWRMPTDAEWTELRTKCTWKWTTQGGRNGYKVTSKSNGNSIFLPAAGCRASTNPFGADSRGHYWSSSLHTDFPFRAWFMNFDSDRVFRNDLTRFHGFSIRPVTE